MAAPASFGPAWVRRRALVSQPSGSEIQSRSATISVVGVASGDVPVPGMTMQGKNQTLRLSLCPVQSTWSELVPLVQDGRLHPERVVTTRMALDDGAAAYGRFHAREDGVMKVVLAP